MLRANVITWGGRKFLVLTTCVWPAVSQSLLCISSKCCIWGDTRDKESTNKSPSHQINVIFSKRFVNKYTQVVLSGCHVNLAFNRWRIKHDATNIALWRLPWPQHINFYLFMTQSWFFAELAFWISKIMHTDAASATWHAPTSLSFVFAKATAAAFHTPAFTLSMLAQFDGAAFFAFSLPYLVLAKAGAAIPRSDFSCVETSFFSSEVATALRFSKRKCTDLDLSLLYILILGTYSKFARKNNFLALGVCFPQPSSSAGCRFAASRSGLQNYQRIVSFLQQKIDEMRCKLDSFENPRSFEKYPTPP